MLLQDMLGDLEGNPEPVEVKIFGDDLATLTSLAERTSGHAREDPGTGGHRRARSAATPS